MIELGHVTERRPPFRYAAYTRVGFSDTDAQGVVYYGRYLPYFDLARTEYHRHLGAISIRGEFAMRASDVEYRGWGCGGVAFDQLAGAQGLKQEWAFFKTVLFRPLLIVAGDGWIEFRRLFMHREDSRVRCGWRRRMDEARGDER